MNDLATRSSPGVLDVLFRRGGPSVEVTSAHAGPAGPGVCDTALVERGSFTKSTVESFRNVGGIGSTVKAVIPGKVTLTKAVIS